MKGPFWAALIIGYYTRGIIQMRNTQFENFENLDLRLRPVLGYPEQ